MALITSDCINGSDDLGIFSSGTITSGGDFTALGDVLLYLIVHLATVDCSPTAWP